MPIETLFTKTSEELLEDSVTSTVTPDISSYRMCQLIDPSAMSGSTENFRHSAGGYFTEGTSLDQPIITFRGFSEYALANPALYSVQTFANDGTTTNIPADIKNSNTILPNRMFVCKVAGNPDVVLDDKMWKILWTGGTIDDIDYPALLNQGIYTNYFTSLKKPYPKISGQYFTNPETVANYATITYQYHQHRSDYQDYIDSLSSELLIPNWYLMKWTTLNATSSTDLPAELYNYFSRYSTVDQPWNIFSANKQIQTYLDHLPTYPALSSSTEAYLEEKFKNIIFTHDSYQDYDLYVEPLLPVPSEIDPDEYDRASPAMPYYINLTFNTEPQAEVFGDIAITADFDTRLMRLLKVAFLQQLPDEIGVSSIPLVRHEKELSSSINTGENIEISSTETTSYRAVDLIELLLYSHAKIKCDIEDFTIVDSNNLETASTYDKDGIYRSMSTMSTLQTLDLLLLHLESGNWDLGGFTTSNIRELLNIHNSIDPEIGDPNSMEPYPKYNETIAYRIEKTIPGDDSGEALQNFWFFNSDRITDFNFFDTQVKYDKNYTYKLYSYVLVYGLKYRYSNLQTTRVIGASNESFDEEGVEKDNMTYCIEYYNPLTDQAVSDLLKVSDVTYWENPFTEEASESSEGSRDISSLATDAQRLAVSHYDPSAAPYLANFVVTAEPDLKILEVPLFEKTLRVLDNPPNRLNVLPTYTQDNSNTIIFKAAYESFYAADYPNTINAAQNKVRDDYLHGKDLLLTSHLAGLEAISRQEFIEIYRMDEKPTSFEDFDDHLLKTVNLTMGNFNESYTDMIFYDTIKSNHTYYYLFRAVNNLGIAGQVDEIMQAEIINDGGYKYAIFNTLFKEDLGTDPFMETTLPAKKVFQISPSIEQVALNSDEVEFDMDAHEQLDVVAAGVTEDLVWGKTFKIRLTSKKTRRQVDLNVTYNQTTDYTG